MVLYQLVAGQVVGVVGAVGGIGVSSGCRWGDRFHRAEWMRVKVLHAMRPHKSLFLGSSCQSIENVIGLLFSGLFGFD